MAAASRATACMSVLQRVLQQRKRPGEQLATASGGAAMGLAGTVVRLTPAACKSLLRCGAAAAFEGLLAATLAAPGKLGLRGFMCAPDIARACMMGLQALAAKSDGSGGGGGTCGSGTGSDNSSGAGGSDTGGGGGGGRVSGGVHGCSSAEWAALRARLLPALRGCELAELQDDVAGLLQGLAAVSQRAGSSQQAADAHGNATRRPRAADAAAQGLPLAALGQQNGAASVTGSASQAKGLENAAPVPDRYAKPVGRATHRRAAKQRAAQKPAAHEQHAVQHPVPDAAPAATEKAAAAGDAAPTEPADSSTAADPSTDDLATGEPPLSPPPPPAAVKQDDWMICPLTQKVMEDPVVLAVDGASYERSAITEWLAANGTSPVTGQRLTGGDAALVPNRALKSLMEAIGQLRPQERPPAAEGLRPWCP